MSRDGNLTVVAPLSTITEIDVSLSTVKVDTKLPLNSTVVTPDNFVPMRVTSEPTPPLLGVKPVRVGYGDTQRKP